MWAADKALTRLKSVNACQILFSEDDYNSNDGIQTAIFGPVFWSAIHMVSFNYPTNPTTAQKQDYEHWLWATGNVLPCGHCRQNFKKNLDAVLRCNSFDSRDTFSRLCYNLHCEVNNMLKKETPLTYEQVRDTYEGFRSRCLTAAQKAQLEAEKKELGCVAAMHSGTSGKVCINVVPRDSPRDTFAVSPSCRPRRVPP